MIIYEASYRFHEGEKTGHGEGQCEWREMSSGHVAGDLVHVEFSAECLRWCQGQQDLHLHNC